MTFANPSWFFAFLLALPLGALVIRATVLRRRALLRLTGLGMNSDPELAHSSFPVILRLSLIAASLALLVVALARPQLGHTYTESMVKGRNILIALDTSKSMLTRDVQPDRLGLARVAALHLAKDLASDRLGVIGFSGSAHLSVPLTLDHTVVIDSLQQLSPDSLPRGGSNLAAAIHLAVDTFENLEFKGDNALVVLSDGESHEGELVSAIDEAREHGMHIIAVGVGTAAGGPVPLPRDYRLARASGTEWVTDSSGRPVESRLDSEALIRTATATGGNYYPLESGRSVTPLVRRSLNSLDRFELAGRQIRTPIEQYQWPLAAALLCLTASLLLPWLRRTRRKATINAAAAHHRSGATATVWILLFFFLPSLLSMKSFEIYEDGDYRRARAHFQMALEEGGNARQLAEWNIGDGASAYQLGAFMESLEPFGKALLSDIPATREKAHYNFGNTLFRIGQSLLPGKAAGEGTDDKAGEGAEQTHGEAEGGSEGEALRIVRRHWLESIEHYESALRIDRDNPWTRRNLEIVREHLARLQEKLSPPPPPEKPESGSPPQEPGTGDDGGRSKPGGKLPKPMSRPRTEDPDSPASLKADHGRDDEEGGESKEREPGASPEEQFLPGDEAEVDELEGDLQRLDGQGAGKDSETNSRSRTDDSAEGSRELSKEEARQALRKYTDEVLGLPDEAIRSARRNYKDW